MLVSAKEMLQKAKAENDNYKVLSAKMETDDDGIPKMDFEIAQKYYGQMSQNLPEGIGLLLSPFDVDDFSFQSSSSADRNAVTDAESQFWEAAGVSSLLFGSTKATSSASLVLSVKPDEALAFSILQQFERFFNRKIKKMNLKILKKVTVVFLTLILACSFVVPTFAAQKPTPEVEPLWDGIATMSVALDFYDDIGTASGRVQKKSTASSISGVLTVYQQNGNDWIYITEWSGSKQIGTLLLGGDFTAVQGATYKAVFTVTAYVNGGTETETFEEIKTNS